MTIEQKAKAYDEALEKAIALYKIAEPMSGCNVLLETVFPELKESKDDRIRKALIKYFSEGREYLSLIPYNKEECVAWFEKQGEQKSVDKVESKFNLYDWVVTDKGDVVQIGAVNNGYYTIYNGMDFNMSYVDKFWHLWTIQDAKDGDVLYAKGGYFKEYIFMFSSFTEDNVISTHFGYDVFHKTFDAKLSRFGRKEDFVSVTPATKEQRDLLFQKMREAGYEWDAEKRELKKIEQSIEIPFGAKDSELQEASYYIPKGYHAEIDGDKVVIKKGEQNPIETRTIGYWNVQEMITPEESLGISSEEWNKIVDDSIYGEPRTAWSKEDEKNLQGIIDDIEANKNNAPDCDLATYDRFLDWLKSLKDRVQPQSQWKPSEEMLEALYRATPENVMEKSEDEMLLDKLYQGLKYGKVLSKK